MKRIITEQLLENYSEYLCEEEKSPRTIEKYLCDLRKLAAYANGRELTKGLVVGYKEYLREERGYCTSSINSFLVAANRLFAYMGWYDLRVKTYKIQKPAFIPERKELTVEEFRRLVKTAKKQGKYRLALILQTICATGIRVGELEAVTVSAVTCSSVIVCSKGKERKILLTRDLQVRLLHYIREQGIKSGSVFQSKSKKAVSRSYVWREMKKLCDEAGVNRSKVFPHNLRHLFARAFYKLDKDIARLADILGHSSIETTRIYVKTTCAKHRKKLERMQLLVGL